jgi:hypothetical protein
MDIGYWLIGWKKKHLLATLGLVLCILLVVFVSLNVGVNPREITGTVKKLGMDTATIYTLPESIITVELTEGNVISVEIPRNINIKPGEEVVLAESSRLLTSGKDYRFLRRR